MYKLLLFPVLYLILTLFTVNIIAYEKISLDHVVSSLKSRENGNGGLVHSRKKRSTAVFPKGSAYKAKFFLGFPFASVTSLGGSFVLAHTVSLPFKKIYPQLDEKERMDLIEGQYVDQQVLSQILHGSLNDINRVGAPFPLNNQQSALQNEISGLDISRIVKEFKENYFHSNWSNDSMKSGRKLTVVADNLAKNILDEIKYNQALKLNRLRAREERIYFYKDMEAFLKKMGLPGKSCMMRTICEVASHPFDDSLFGELLNIVMSPSSGGKTEYPWEEKDYDDFVDAEQRGKASSNCESLYRECTDSVFFFVLNLFNDLFL